MAGKGIREDADVNQEPDRDEEHGDEQRVSQELELLLRRGILNRSIQSEAGLKGTDDPFLMDRLGPDGGDGHDQEHDRELASGSRASAS
jgi:hypothetical protein